MIELSELTQDELIEYVTDQRWYASKGREVAGAGIVDQRGAARSDPGSGRDRLP